MFKLGLTAKVKGFTESGFHLWNTDFQALRFLNPVQVTDRQVESDNKYFNLLITLFIPNDIFQAQHCLHSCDM